MRPTRIEEEMSNVYGVEERLDMGEDTGHIQIPEDLEEKEAFQIHKIHLDVNHHVNNGQYVQMAAEYLPEGFRIHQMRAEYKKSAVLNDMIYPRVGRWEDRYTAILGNETGKPYAVIEFR
jgi:acyl-ACP thioesterase